jgi:hypothetical protein
MPAAPSIHSYDPPANLNARDVSKAFYMIRKEETPFFNAIAVGNAAANTKHYWWDDARLVRSTKIATTFATPWTSLIVTAGTGQYVRAGMLLEVAGLVYKVSSVSTDTLTVAAQAGSTPTGTYAVGVSVNFMGMAAQEGEEYTATPFNFEVERMNLTQIFTDYVNITGTQRAITREVNDGDLLLQMSAKKLDRMYLTLARAVWANPIVSAPLNSDTGRIMGGTDAFLTTNGYNITTPTAVTAAGFDDWLLELDKMGAVLSELWMNPTDLAKFAAIDATKLLLQRQDQTRGLYVNKYISKYGHELTLNTDVQAPAGKIRAIKTSDVVLCPLQGRQFQIVDLNKTGDSDKKQLVGEYTLEVRNSAIAGYFVPS